MSAGTNVGTAKIGRCGCFPELVQMVGVAIIATDIYAQLAKWLSASVVCLRKGPGFESRWSHFFFSV